MKRYNFVVTVVLCCLLGYVVPGLIKSQTAVGAGESKLKVIRANRFELVDKSGTKRASLELKEKDNTVALYLWDPKGKPLVELSTSEVGSALIMKFEDKVAAGFGVEKNNCAFLALNNAKTGKPGPGVSMSVLESGAGIILFDKNGRPQAVTPTKRSVTPPKPPVRKRPRQRDRRNR